MSCITSIGYDTSTQNEYVLECNRRLTFEMFDEMKCHNYTIIDDDDCELGLMETMLKLRLAVTSTSVLGLEINSSNAVTTVTIDDRGEPECCE